MKPKKKKKPYHYHQFQEEYTDYPDNKLLKISKNITKKYSKIEIEAAKHELTSRGVLKKPMSFFGNLIVSIILSICWIVFFILTSALYSAYVKPKIFHFFITFADSLGIVKISKIMGFLFGSIQTVSVLIGVGGCFFIFKKIFSIRIKNSNN